MTIYCGSSVACNPQYPQGWRDMSCRTYRSFGHACCPFGHAYCPFGHAYCPFGYEYCPCGPPCCLSGYRGVCRGVQNGVQMTAGLSLEAVDQLGNHRENQQRTFPIYLSRVLIQVCDTLDYTRCGAGLRALPAGKIDVFRCFPYLQTSREIERWREGEGNNKVRIAHRSGKKT